MSPRSVSRHHENRSDDNAVQELVAAGIKVLEGPEVRAQAAAPLVPTTMIFGVLQFANSSQAVVFQRLASCWSVRFKHQLPANITSNLEATCPGKVSSLNAQVDGNQVEFLLLTGDCLSQLTRELFRSYGPQAMFVYWHEIQPLLTCRAC
jgi:hypothetical protein